jgi:hypothetical protein
MQTNDGFESESCKKEATKPNEDIRVSDENVTGKEGHTAVNGSHSQDIDLNNDDVQIDVNDKSTDKKKPKGGSKERR